MRTYLLTFMSVAVFVLAGCGDGAAFKTAPVSGVVTVDGAPVEGAEVHFIGAGMNAIGKTDAQGKYELEQGAVIGENQVYISKFTGGAVGDQAAVDSAQMEAMAISQGSSGVRGGPKQLIPARYSDPASMSLSVNVPDEGTSAADFQLSSK